MVQTFPLRKEREITFPRKISAATRTKKRKIQATCALRKFRTRKDHPVKNRRGGKMGKKNIYLYMILSKLVRDKKARDTKRLKKKTQKNILIIRQGKKMREDRERPQNYAFSLAFLQHEEHAAPRRH